MSASEVGVGSAIGAGIDYVSKIRKSDALLVVLRPHKYGSCGAQTCTAAGNR